MYEKWLKTGDPGKKEEGEKKKRGRPAGSKNKEGSEPAKLLCPNLNEEVESSACETCPNREGCPVWV